MPIEAPVLALLSLIAAGMLGFAALASRMIAGDLDAFDRALLLALRTPGDPGDPVGPAWVELAMRDVTALGGFVVLGLVTLIVIGDLLLRGQARSALVLAVAVGMGQVLSHAAKAAFGRPRPDLVPHGVEVTSASFPSGHSMMAAVTYLTLAAMLARVEPRRRLKAFYIAVAVALAGAVGASRVYLGVHYPSDVLAGWTAGGAWALICYAVAATLAREGRIEPGRDAG